MDNWEIKISLLRMFASPRKSIEGYGNSEDVKKSLFKMANKTSYFNELCKINNIKEKNTINKATKLLTKLMNITYPLTASKIDIKPGGGI